MVSGSRGASATLIPDGRWATVASASVVFADAPTPRRLDIDGMSRFQVVICGGGIAGVEGLLRLRRLAGEQLELTLVCAEPDLVYRPLAVGEPFGLPGARRYPLERIAADAGARWIKDRLASVDSASRTIQTDSGAELPYDALLLAVGARETSPFPPAHVFSDRRADVTFEVIVGEIEAGLIEAVAFVLPNEWVWPLPLYELALMTAQHARRMSRDPQITFITSEGRPLKAFGQAAGDAVLDLLKEAGIALHTGVAAQVPAPGVITFGGAEMHADRIVTVPRITGPAVKGVPAGARWFVPVDQRCVVPSTEDRVFAAGDATDFPVKQGGIGAQQADTAAAGIAHLAGVADRPPPLHPVMRGALLTGARPVYVAAQVVNGLGWHSEIYKHPPWPAHEKIVAEELGGYLALLDSR
jgi:sulfide:quinone oxidoreductase